ncbi:MAG TPA: hypothetical protein VMF61_12040 [Candidatus Acidoferrales bacterium]|nr:hypothetical protein [Candidatus Acidoferrales bacterium]
MSDLRRRVSGASAFLCAAVLAGCGGSNPPVAPVAQVQSADSSGSRIDPHAAGSDLLYVSDLNQNAVYIFTYPAGKLVGTLKGFHAPHGECLDAAGDVFVTDSADREIFEYPRGSTHRIATLDDSSGFPMHCAVDPLTGNLVVTNFPLLSGAGNVVTYVHARGSAQPLAHSSVGIPYFAAYDAKGNLWVDGMDSHAQYFQFGELPAGRKKWRAVTLPHRVAFPGAVQWVGDELVVGDQVNLDGPSAIYEFSLRNGRATLVGTTPLRNSCDVLQFQVDGGTVVASNTCEKAVLYFDFPRGGKSIQSITTDLSQPVGIVIDPRR